MNNSTIVFLAKLASEAQKFVERINSLEDTVKNKFTDQAEQEIDTSFQRIIDEWYGEYPQRSYHPTESLKEVYKIEKSKNGISVNISPDNIPDKHRLSPQGIYDLVVVEGYHGGAKKGTIGIHGHPYPGTPMYVQFHNNNPVGWMRPPKGIAKQSFSIEKDIINKGKYFENKILPKIAQEIFIEEVNGIHEDFEKGLGKFIR